MDLIDHALNYHRYGFSVVPIEPNGKRPIIKWTEFQERISNENEIRNWWNKNPNLNIGIITGKLSGVTVMDIDNDNALEIAKDKGLPKCPIVRTGRGYHFYFKFGGESNFQKRDDLPGIDLRGDGGIIVMPPSNHSSGKKYEWLNKFCDFKDNLPCLPEWLLVKNVTSEKLDLSKILEGAKKGNRNQSTTRFSGMLCNYGIPLNDAIKFILTANRYNKPPEDENSVIAVVKSVYEKHYKETETTSLSAPKNVKQLLAEDIPPIDYHLSDLVPKRGKVLITGPAGGAKSMFAMNICCAVTCGISDYLNSEVSEGKVLYIDLEMGDTVLRSRFDKMVKEKELSPDGFYLNSLSSIDIENEEVRSQIEGWISQLDVDIVVFDPLGYLWIGNENESVKIRQLTAYLNSLIDQFGVTIFLIHHWRKVTDKFKEGADMAAGSYFLNAWAESHITLKGNPHSSVVISQVKNRFGEKINPFMVKMDEKLWLEYIGSFDKKYSIGSVVNLFESFGSEYVSVQDLARKAKKESGPSRRTIDALIEELIASKDEYYLGKKGEEKCSVQESPYK